jgi:hypothetical protein
VVDDPLEGFLKGGVQYDDQGATCGLRRALVGAGEAAGDLPVGKRRVVGAVVRERPAEHTLKKRFCFLEVGGVKLDVAYLVGLVHGGENWAPPQWERSIEWRSLEWCRRKWQALFGKMTS